MLSRSKPRAVKAKQKSRESGPPRHVAIIMDGNARWARQRGLSKQAGYRAGTENLRPLLKAFAERGVEYVTLFAFSTENWKRPKREVNPLLRLIGRVIDKELQALHENGVRLVHIGSLAPLSDDLRKLVERAIELTKDNDRITVCVAFNYGSRAEIVEAARGLIRDGVKAEDLTEETFEAYLSTAGLPDPDLVIRTAGEMRLSNFLLWQAAYAEFYATPVYWPDFDEAEIDRALEAYSQRVRRFGGSVAGNGNGANGSHA